jgi:hypothetical protein
MDKIGLILEVKDGDGNTKFVPEDDVYPLRSI